MSETPMPNMVMPRGDKTSPVCCLGYAPSEEDEKKGVVFMDTSGWFLDKLFRDASIPQPYFITMQPLASVKLPEELCFQAMLQILEMQKHTFIVTCDSRREKGERTTSDVLKLLVPETQGNLSKYAGSLLVSPFISWPHYILPIQSPSYMQQDYAERDIAVSLDLGKLREEIKYWKQNSGRLQPLPIRELITEPSFSELCDFLENECLRAKMVANDIETIRPVKHTSKKAQAESHFKNFPGCPYTNSFATSPKRAISFSLWDYTDDELVQIWRLQDKVFREVPQIGQNWFLFDIQFLEALGNRPCLYRSRDTIIRHHILWPELPHSLQFQTRQYTRQPYYKDEGKHWNPKQKRSLMHYNCLDTAVDYEIYLAQEEEFAERPQLNNDPIIEAWIKSRESQPSL